jgi:hypothetical protein
MADKPKYSQDDLNTPEQHSANSIIMEVACELAEVLTEEECKKNGIKIFNDEEDEEEATSYTDESQDIFNSHYDVKMDEVYAIANTIEGKLTYENLLEAVNKAK